MNRELLVENVRPMAGPAVDVLTSGGMITRVASGIAPPPGATVIDGQGGILLPGFVDAHMHSGFRSPSGLTRGGRAGI